MQLQTVLMPMINPILAEKLPQCEHAFFFQAS